MNNRFSFCFSLALILFLFNTAFAIPQNERTWKDASGKFEVKATFVRIDGEKVVLKKSDGTQLSVPVDKLSPVDQGYVEGLRASSGGGDDGNPFEQMGSDDSGKSSSSAGGASDSAGSSNSDTTSSGAPREITVNFESCTETAISKGNWSPKLGDQPSLPFSLKPISLDRKQDFWERYAGAAFNVQAKRAVITHHFSRPGKKEVVTRLELVDIETGKRIGNASGDGKWEALAIHDDGEQVVIQNMADDKSTMGQLGTVKIQGKKLLPLDLWKPYGAMKEEPKEQIVRFARFINDGRLLTLSQNGKVVIWDFETRKPVRRFSYHGACQPSLSHDRKHLAICGGDIFGIVNLDDESEEPSVIDAPQMNYWLSSSFSPSCKRFAAATMQKLMVWDVATGDVLYEGKIPGLQTNGNLLFPHEDFVIVNNDKLFEYSSGIKVWRYGGAVPKTINGETVFIHVDQKGGKIMPIELPHAEALTMLDAAKSQSDLFILKKGSSVSIDLSEVPQQYRGDVEQSLKENLERKGFEYESSAPVSLKASISGPTQEAVSYHFAGSFVVRQFNSNLKLVYEGQTLWTRGANNIPGMVSGNGKEEIKKQLDQAGRSPNIKFFAGAELPDYLQKPTGDGTNNRDAQMLGSSEVGFNGIK